MKNFLNKALVLTFLISFAACDDFGDTNIDPNRPTQVAPETLLASAERSISDVVGAAMGPLFSQHLSEITYTEASRYQSIQADFSGWYTGVLQNLERIIELNTDEETRTAATASGSNANQIAVANILKAYFYQFLTDRWGPIPYSEALQAEDGKLTPAYDSQEAIYNGLFEQLKNAVAMINTSEPGVSGDFILNGDMEAWAKFANTLRMNMAIRIADVNDSKGKSEFMAALAAGVIDANVMYPYLPESANENPWFARFRTRADYAVSTLLVDLLSGVDDPRLASFADPTNASVTAGSPEIVGMPYGLSNPGALPENVSFPNSTYMKAQDAPLPIFTLAQVNFNLAEAVVRGWISGDAEQYYRQGIMESWNQWSVSYDMAAFEAYYSQPEVTWNAANWKELIGFQKWIALYGQGYEAWFEWRRLDAPQLGLPQEPFNPSGAIPLRFIYPSLEADLNGVNYNAALGLLGGPDSDGTPVWWDVN